ncbi:MAG TPA: hypothetical protein VLB80_03130 [Candidatus Babeliales bacterium]|nr:hypothetical protein [Candidatus Babeliales bacterium]
MKNSKIFFSLLFAIVDAFIINAVDYDKGEVDENGKNYWHILAKQCASNNFEQILREELKKVNNRPEGQASLLLELIGQKDNNGKTPADVAGEESWKVWYCHGCKALQVELNNAEKQYQEYKNYRIKAINEGLKIAADNTEMAIEKIKDKAK